MHKLIAWLTDNFVPAWKAISIVLTGSFGLLGLLTEFKDEQSKRITRWGWVSLSGIVVSTIFGVTAQLKESHDDAKRTLTTLREIKKILSPLDVSEVNVDLKASCELPALAAFCGKSTDSSGQGTLKTLPSDYQHLQIWIRLFDKRDKCLSEVNKKDEGMLESFIVGQINFYVEGGVPDGSDKFYFSRVSESDLSRNTHEEYLEIRLKGAAKDLFRKGDALRSVSDLSEGCVIVEDTSRHNFVVSQLFLETVKGQSIALYDFKKATLQSPNLPFYYGNFTNINAD